MSRLARNPTKIKIKKRHTKGRWTYLSVTNTSFQFGWHYLWINLERDGLSRSTCTRQATHKVITLRIPSKISRRTGQGFNCAVALRKQAVTVSMMMILSLLFLQIISWWPISFSGLLTFFFQIFFFCVNFFNKILWHSCFENGMATVQVIHKF